MDTLSESEAAAAAERKARKAATLWNVRGVDEAHRAMAKEAAEKCDMTLGRWLTEVIEKVAPIGTGQFKVLFVPIEKDAEEPKISENQGDGQPVKGRAPAATRS